LAQQNKEKHAHISAGVEEISELSVRNVINRSNTLKEPRTARPVVNRSIDDGFKSNRVDASIKKTHVSVIEEEIEDIKPNIITIHTEQTPRPTEPIPEENKSTLSFALKFRFLLTLIQVIFIESMPFVLIFHGYSSDFSHTAKFLTTQTVLALVFKIFIFSKLCNSISFARLTRYFLCAMAICSLVLIVLGLIRIHSLIYEIVLSLGFLAAEALLPVGGVLVSDSVGKSVREETFIRSDLQSIIAKIIGQMIAASVTLAFGESNSFTVVFVGLMGLFSFSINIEKKFSFLTSAPFKL
jgi:hypothetical protein